MLSLSVMLAIFHKDPLSCYRIYCLFLALHVFIMKEYWVLSCPFSAVVEMIVWGFFPFVLLIWHIILIFLC